MSISCDASTPKSISSNARSTLLTSVFLSSAVLPNLGEAKSISENKPPKSSSLSCPKVLSSIRFNERSSIGKMFSLRLIASITDENKNFGSMK